MQVFEVDFHRGARGCSEVYAELFCGLGSPDCPLFRGFESHSCLLSIDRWIGNSSARDEKLHASACTHKKGDRSACKREGLFSFFFAGKCEISFVPSRIPRIPKEKPEA